MLEFICTAGLAAFVVGLSWVVFHGNLSEIMPHPKHDTRKEEEAKEELERLCQSVWEKAKQP